MYVCMYVCNSTFDPSIHLTIQDLQVMPRLILPAFVFASKALKLTRLNRDVSYTWGEVRPLSVQFWPSWHIYIVDGLHGVLHSLTPMVSL